MYCIVLAVVLVLPCLSDLVLVACKKKKYGYFFNVIIINSRSSLWLGSFLCFYKKSLMLIKAAFI